MKGLRKNTKKGFTLIEIIVVLVIIAILAAVAVPSMIGYVNDARGKAYASEARVGLTAAQAVVTEIVASGAGTVSSNGYITWNTGYSGVSNILLHPTFAGMVQDVTGAVYVAPTGSTAASLSSNPFRSVTISTDTGATANRVTGVTYFSTPDTPTDAVIVTIAAGTTTVSKAGSGTTLPAIPTVAPSGG